MDTGTELGAGLPVDGTMGPDDASPKATTNRNDGMKSDRDIEKTYALPEFIEKLRRLADALENGTRFEIEIAGERISVPVRATYNIEHERGSGEEEIEFQIKWAVKEG